MPRPEWEREVDDLVQSVAEWDDRSSPDDYPNHLLVTAGELKEFARDVAALSDAREMELLGANNRYQQEARDARAALKGGFQSRVDLWLIACFGQAIARDKVERNHRFLEEALELVQSGGCTASEAHQLVDYVFGRQVGEMSQEVGGVMNTLAALCLAYGLDMSIAGENELTRCWSKIEKIRAKQAAKPKHGPLPEAPAWKPTHRHLKLGSDYQIVGTAEVQVSSGDGLTEAELVIVYRAKDGTLWVRRKSEFEDGRFEPLSQENANG